MISNERLKQLIAFTSALVELNKLGVSHVPLCAEPAEALDVLKELQGARSLNKPPDAA